ncbi:WhiB family transcriptional regulator [Rhodococcus triatomae]|uniref:Transcriptional regulator WhiB n=1 Tax=Rhodococcus triatomae TaxID=300028 RepID=A0A1G8F424_9NOCA|nr:WhiB family transcriptional regulator [Rhodococcus triatomae]QNG24705.1 WhiB family transcriptional regulator [Rhodococcus triatomae]SDH76872.1 WhiB family transcriptional regulator, redox-sensing transcriptional regulator [Rhodococcus triatomae]
MSATTCRGVSETVTTATTFIEVVASRRELPCRGGDPDLWFADSPAQLEEAKTLCGSCPIRQRCLAAALDRGEPWGVWGGEIFDQGAVIARKRPRGRPRKNPAPLCA